MAPGHALPIDRCRPTQARVVQQPQAMNPPLHEDFLITELVQQCIGGLQQPVLVNEWQQGHTLPGITLAIHVNKKLLGIEVQDGGLRVIKQPPAQEVWQQQPFEP